MLSVDGGNDLSKEQRLEELRDKLSSKNRQKVSLDVPKSIGSDYLQASDVSMESGIAAVFKKPKRVLGKKRQAEEDILDVFTKVQSEDSSQDNGLGTKAQSKLL